MAEPSAKRRRNHSEVRKRAHVRAVRLDETEQGLFDAAYERYLSSTEASQYGDSVSAFIRYMCIGQGAKRLPKRRRHKGLPPDITAQLGALMTELARQGNNLNQMSRRTNTGLQSSPYDIQSALHENRETLSTLRKLLGWESAE